MSDIRKLWEDSHFIYWENFEERFREPVSDLTDRLEALGGEDAAAEWLHGQDIDAEKLPFRPKLLNVTTSNDFERQDVENPRGRILVEFDDQEPNTLVFPIVDWGTVIDYGGISTEDFGFSSVRMAAIWLGGDNINGDEVRLHSGPMDWLAAGASGCVYIDEQRRTPLKRLQAVSKILCDDISLALEAWDWGFGAEDAALDRFVIDDTDENVESYFKAQIERRMALRAKVAA